MKSYVQGIIHVDIFGFLHSCYHRAKFCNISIADSTCSKPSGETEEARANFIDICCLIHAHLSNKNAAIGHESDQVALFQTSTGFSNWSTTDVEHLRQGALIYSIARL